MNGLLAGVAIANPVLTGLLTLLVFLEGKKSNKRFEQIESALRDGNRSLIEAVDNNRNAIRDSVDKQKGDFAKIADRLESLSKDTEESAKNFVEISDALTKSSAVSKEALGKVTTGLEKHATSVSSLVNELTRKVSSTSQDSIKSLSAKTTEGLTKISQEVSKVQSSNQDSIKSLSAKTTEGLTKIAQEVSKVQSSNQDSIKSLATSTTDVLAKISQEVGKIESSQNNLNTNLNKTINELIEKTGKTNDAINGLKETLNSTVSL